MQIGIRLAMSFAMAMMVSGCSMRYEFYNYVSDGQETPYLDLSAELVGTVVARDEEGRRLVVTGNPYTLFIYLNTSKGNVRKATAVSSTKCNTPQIIG